MVRPPRERSKLTLVVTISWFQSPWPSLPSFREEIAFEMYKEQQLALQQTRQLLSLLDQNNEMTLVVRQLSERIESLTSEIHGKEVIEVPWNIKGILFFKPTS